MDHIVSELKTEQVKKYNIKKLLKKYEKEIGDKWESGDTVEPTNNLHIMYSLTLKYHRQNNMLIKENIELKNKLNENLSIDKKIEDNIINMAKPNINSTVSQIKDYIRTNKLNHPKVKLSLTRPQLIAGLKLIDHWDDATVKTKKKRVKKVVVVKPSKPAFKIDKSKQSKQTPSKVVIDESKKPLSNTMKIEPNLEKKIDQLSKQYIEEIKKMKPFKKLADIQSTFKKYEKKIYDFIRTHATENDEQLRNYFDDNWLDKISEAIPDGRKKPPAAKPPVPPPPKTQTKQQIADNKFDKEVKPEIIKEVYPIILKWLKDKNDPQLLATIQNADGTPLKKIKGMKKPLFVKTKEQYDKDYQKKLKEIMKRFGYTTMGRGYDGVKRETFNEVLAIYKDQPPSASPPTPTPPSTKAPATTWNVNKAKRTRLNTAFRASQSKNKKSIYVVLGMDANSDPSPEEVKQVCRKLKLKHHPDKGGDANIFDLVQKACDIFIESFK